MRFNKCTSRVHSCANGNKLEKNREKPLKKICFMDIEHKGSQSDRKKKLQCV